MVFQKVLRTIILRVYTRLYVTPIVPPHLFVFLFGSFSFSHFLRSISPALNAG